MVGTIDGAKLGDCDGSSDGSVVGTGVVGSREGTGVLGTGVDGTCEGVGVVGT